MKSFVKKKFVGEIKKKKCFIVFLYFKIQIHLKLKHNIKATKEKRIQFSLL